MKLQVRIVLAIILPALVALSGSAGFHFIEHWPWFDSFYMTLTTMTTIGYGEISSVVALRTGVQQLSDHLRVSHWRFHDCDL